MTFSGNREWSNVEKLDGLEKWILVHSHLYYDTDKTVVSDRMFDKNCWQLVDLIRECTQEEREASRWWYVFNNFDGCTGYDLFMRLNSDDQHYIDDMCGMVIWGVETDWGKSVKEA